MERQQAGILDIVKARPAQTMWAWSILTVLVFCAIPYMGAGRGGFTALDLLQQALKEVGRSDWSRHSGEIVITLVLSFSAAWIAPLLCLGALTVGKSNKWAGFQCQFLGIAFAVLNLIGGIGTANHFNYTPGGAFYVFIILGIGLFVLGFMFSRHRRHDSIQGVEKETCPFCKETTLRSNAKCEVCGSMKR